MHARSTLRFVPALAFVLALVLGTPTMSHAQNGNSGAAHACQKGGYAWLVGSGGESFSNTGQCVSFAAQGGEFASGIVIPAGYTATFTNIVFSACNELALGYEIGGITTAVASKGPGCGTITAPDATVGPFTAAVLITPYLVDIFCGGAVFPAYGGHSRVIGGPEYYGLDFADGYVDCSRVGVPASFAGEGNLSVDLVIAP